MEDFGCRLKRLIRVKGKKQSDLARETGISQITVSAYARGERIPSVGNLIAIADYLDVSTDCLLGRSDKFPEWYENKAAEAFDSVKGLIDVEQFADWVVKYANDRY